MPELVWNESPECLFSSPKEGIFNTGLSLEGELNVYYTVKKTVKLSMFSFRM